MINYVIYNFVNIPNLKTQPKSKHVFTFVNIDDHKLLKLNMYTQHQRALVYNPKVLLTNMVFVKKENALIYMIY